MQPKGAKRNMVDQAIFSNEGPNLNSPAETNIPRVIPNMYKLKKRKNKCRPRSNIDIPNNGDVSNIAGTSPINALIKAVKTNDISNIELFLEQENRLSKLEPWCKLDKTAKISKLNIYIEDLNKEHDLSLEEREELLQYLQSCLDRKYLHKVKAHLRA